MADVLTIDDLVADKKHSTFFAEVVTGKTGGLPTGADISTSTNQVTGQVQKTLPQVLAELGMVVQTWTATSGGTLTNAAQVFLNDKVGSAGLGNYYAWSGTFPKTVTAGLDPAGTAGFIMRSEVGLRSELAANTGAQLVKMSSGITVEASLALKANTAEVNSAIALKANTTDVNSALLNRTASVYVSVSMSASAMTFTVPKQLLKFRNTSLTTGGLIEITPSADLTLTIPNGATLGTVSAQLANLVPIIFYNAGIPVLGVVNLAGGLDLSEAGLLSATAISTSADIENIAYASSAVTGSPYIVAGLVQSVQVTAGAWLTAPNIVPKNTNLASMIGGIGFYPPVDVKASRAFNTVYYNTTGRPKKVKVVASLPTTINGFIINMTVNGVLVDSNGFDGTSTSATRYFSVEWLVPPGGSYLVSWANALPTIVEWIEA